MEWFEKFYTREYMDLVGFASTEKTRLEADFAINALNVAKGYRLCDLCCGYGRHLYEIARRTGCFATGVDLSSDYLALAAERFKAPGVDFIRADMRRLPFDREFDGMMNLFTSFGFFDTDEENALVLEQVRRALKDKGLFLLDYENKYFFIENDVGRKERTWIPLEDGRICLVENRYDLFREREIFETAILDGGRVSETTGYDIRLYTYPEIEKMLSSVGLEIERAWGDYDGREYSLKSRRLILLSRKR